MIELSAYALLMLPFLGMIFCTPCCGTACPTACTKIGTTASWTVGGIANTSYCSDCTGYNVTVTGPLLNNSCQFQSFPLYFPSPGCDGIGMGCNSSIYESGGRVNVDSLVDVSSNGFAWPGAAHFLNYDVGAAPLDCSAIGSITPPQTSHDGGPDPQPHPFDRCDFSGCTLTVVF